VQLPPLLVALCRQSVDEVRAVLADSPELATEPFWDHGVEPPLCCAMRHQCSADIVEVLLQHGADVNAVNDRGQTPLSIHASTSWGYAEWLEFPCSMDFWLAEEMGPVVGSLFDEGNEQRHDWLQHSLDVAQALVKAGADPLSPGITGAAPIDLASAAGNSHLVQLWMGGDAWSPEVEDVAPSMLFPRLLDFSSLDGMPLDQQSDNSTHGPDNFSVMSCSRSSSLEWGLPLQSLESPAITPQELESFDNLIAGRGREREAVMNVPEPPVTPCTTPRAAKRNCSPPGAPRTPSLPTLLEALFENSCEKVRKALEEDPEEATGRSLDLGAEPPLCVAVRHRCDVEVVRLLLAHGADVEAVDCSGRTPLSILAEMPCEPLGWPLPLGIGSLGLPVTPPLLDGEVQPTLNAIVASYEEEMRVRARQESCQVAEALTEAGARPLAPDAAGNRPIDLAYSAGNLHLVRLWQSQTLAEAENSEN